MSRHIDTSNPKRLRILSLVRRNPSISHRELADILGMSTTGIHHHLVQLEKEGVITRSHEVGRPGNYYKPIRKAIKKTRRQVSSAKLSEYGKLGRGKNAFVPRSPDQWVAGGRKSKREKLQERIEDVVKKALKRESNPQYDVVRHENRRVRLTGAHKLG